MKALVSARMQRWGLCLLLAVLAGCKSEPFLMPTPVVFQDERLDFQPRLPAVLHSMRLPVFYATTRAAGEPGHYINAAGNGMTLGVADVQLGTADSPAAEADWA